jgi:hypothetical protein
VERLIGRCARRNQRGRECLFDRQEENEEVDGSAGEAALRGAISILVRGGGHLGRLALPGRDKTRMP